MSIRRKPLRKRKSEINFIGGDPPIEQTDNYKEPDNWTIITALDRILYLAEDSSLSDVFWESAKNPLAFLNKELGLTNMQIVVLAIMVETGEPVSWKRLGDFLNCSRLSIMCYSEEVEDLLVKRWIKRRGVHELSGFFEGFVLEQGVVTALRHNKPFVPEKIDGLTEQQFVDKLEGHIERNMKDHNARFKDDEEWMLQLITANAQLPLCRTALLFDDIHVQSLLLLVVVDYAQWEGSDGEGLTISTIDDLYPEDFQCDGLRFELRNGTHPLMEFGFIEHKCVDGQVNAEQYVLTRKAKDELLSAYTPSHSKCGVVPQSDRFVKNHTAIKEKPLFFNASDQEQINRLTSLLSTENLPSIQQRLEEQGMRKGFACLFYGAPGTGKTETVLQIARQTGRDLMQVDIAGLRDKWVGESEKNIKQVFARYRKLCKTSEVMPILFFNEADAIINKRTENVEHSVDKMDNAMQNIILQEIEDLDGILIATTNLTSNLDRAFERRFLYKVEFHKPNTEVKTQIWRSMLKDISADEAHQLAIHFDFSGGQIENIARKRTVDYILSGRFASLEEIEGYCRAELLSGKQRRSIGFMS
jgi:hypothetical protein